MSRAGVTLIELVVVLVMLGVLAMLVAGMAQPGARLLPDPEAEALTRARRAAIRDGSPRQLTLQVGARGVVVVVLPDGRVLGDFPDGVDMLTGTREVPRLGP